MGRWAMGYVNQRCGSPIAHRPFPIAHFHGPWPIHSLSHTSCSTLTGFVIVFPLTVSVTM